MSPYFGLHGKLPSVEFLEYMALLKGIDARKRRDLVLDLLEKVNLLGETYRPTNHTASIDVVRCLQYYKD